MCVLDTGVDTVTAISLIVVYSPDNLCLAYGNWHTLLKYGTYVATYMLDLDIV